MAARPEQRDVGGVDARNKFDMREKNGPSVFSGFKKDGDVTSERGNPTGGCEREKGGLGKVIGSCSNNGREGAWKTKRNQRKP